MSSNDDRSNEDVGVACPKCNSVFDTERGMKIHHSYSHGESLAGVLVECETCGGSKTVDPHLTEEQERFFCDSECMGEWMSSRPIEEQPAWKGGKIRVSCETCGEGRLIYPSDRSDSGLHFCDQACQGAWRAENRTGEDNPNWVERIPTECASCGAGMDLVPSVFHSQKNHFCNRSCKGDWMSENWAGEGHPRWDPVEVVCETCGDGFLKESGHYERTNRHFCSNRCRGVGLTGPDGPLYRGGSLVYHAVLRDIRCEDWAITSRRVREASGQCEMCGEDAIDRLNAHHIVPILCGGTNADELLMPLCNPCHSAAEKFTRELIDPVLVE